jgi:hypothetical protein
VTYKYVAVATGTEYHPDFVKLWGKTKETTGYGPVPIDTTLVQDHLGSYAIAGGPLIAVPCTQAELDALHRPTPIAL